MLEAKEYPFMSSTRVAGILLGTCLSSGCCNKKPQTERLINNRNLFLMVLETGNSESKTPADLVPGEDPLPSLYRWLSSHCDLTLAEGSREISRASFITALIPFMRALPS